MAVVVWLTILLVILLAATSTGWQEVCVAGQQLEADGTLTTWPVTCGVAP